MNIHKKCLSSFINALAFLTIIPVAGIRKDHEPYNPGAAFFPFVGLIIGGVTLLGARLLFFVFPAHLASVLTVVIWIMMSGALHLDGLADCCDGLFVSALPEKRLQIMHDSRVGTFGVVGIFCYLLVKVVAVASLPEEKFIAGLLLSPLIARLLILFIKYYPVKWSEGGMGSLFASTIGWGDILLAIILPLVMILYFGNVAWIALLTAWIVQVLLLILAQRRLGLINGDVLGMMVELCELAALLSFSVQFQ